MVAMGAMHLKDSWSDEFDEDDPRPFKLEDGSTQNTDFMLDWNRYDYLERGGSITLSKELTSGCTMCVSMPREGVTVGDYIRCGDAWRNTRITRRASARSLPAIASSTCPSST